MEKILQDSKDWLTRAKIYNENLKKFRQQYIDTDDYKSFLKNYDDIYNRVNSQVLHLDAYLFFCNESTKTIKLIKKELIDSKKEVNRMKSILNNKTMKNTLASRSAHTMREYTQLPVDEIGNDIYYGLSPPRGGKTRRRRRS